MGSVPNNIWGYQYPHTGNAYAAAQCYFTAHYREYFGCQLVSPLSIGQQYFVSFYINCAKGGLAFAGGACNKIGALFSTVQYSISSPVPIRNFAHIYTDSIITDTLNWTQISGSFVADSNYNYVSFGNFFDDAFTDTIQSNGWLRAVYFFDDICVTATSSENCSTLTGGIEAITPDNQIIIAPNPFQDKINITTKRTEVMEVCLYDVTTRKLLQKKFTNSTTLNTEQLPKGMYIYEVRNKNGIVKNGKVIKE